ncbi:MULTISPECIES: hypothetical protein [Pseudomonas]|uniref:hypothetical protein n=1 Tax=Pseudomonas TaxID=286 RepID=UPI000B359D66|nr:MULTISPECIES: hypothetical protein [Pseudomonas]PMY56084.1 hypothetical protein C1X70_02490 [Pseudomonas sp. FW305-53]PMY88951.1 hypothetical protein C1X68_01110 [Pseudomonas sp. FW303-C2]PMY92132.1 hypothetical protein C1X67_14805 [Pseudomonas sp. FW305-62]PNA46205.1 hypothetical protein C1X71_01790 [Pseudomonas sp. FW306-2-2C-A10BC]PNA89090.1 hypothetical protein C1X66_02720 [Pseudomonas sp. MPR-R3B]
MSTKKITALLVLAFSFFGVTSCANIRNYSEVSSERNKSIVPDIDYYDLAYNVDVIVLPTEIKTKENADTDNNFSGELQISNWGNSIKNATQKEIHNSDRFIEFGHYSGRIEIGTEISSVSISNARGGTRSKCNVVYTYKDLAAGKILSRHDSTIELIAPPSAIPKTSNSFSYSLDQLTYAIAREAISGLIRLSPVADIQLTQKQVKFYNSNIKRKPNQIISYVPIDSLIHKNKKELNSAFSMAKKTQKNSNKSTKKNKPTVKLDTVSAPAAHPLKSNKASDTPTANTVTSSDNTVSQNSSQAATKNKKDDSNSSEIASSSERLKDGAIKNNEPNDDSSGYIATPENHQPQIDVSAEQERALDECLKKEKEKLQGATDNAASRTGYTTVSGLYQPQNKILAVQERAMDECLKKAKAKLR